MATSAVQAAAVTAAERAGQQELTAHVIPRLGEELTEGKLRRLMSERLPDYMIPLRVIFRQSFPVTTTGKTDRRRLAAEAASGDAGSDPADGNGSGVEERVAGLFAKILGRPAVKPHERFYDLGGDSLRMHELMMEVTRLYGVQIPFEKIGEDASPASLAAWIRRYRESPPSRKAGTGPSRW